MSVNARELEDFFQRHGSLKNAQTAAGLYVKAKAIEDRVGLSQITPKVELPSSIRRSVLKADPRDVHDFREAFELRKIKVTDRAWDILENAGGLTGRGQDMELVIPSARDLGFRRSLLHEEFLEAGQAAGLNLIHPEVLFYQRLNDSAQSSGDVYWAGMNPVVGRDRGPRVLGLAHYSYRLWLDTRWVLSEDLWYPDRRLAFSSTASGAKKA